MQRTLASIVLGTLLAVAPPSTAATGAGVRIKELARIATQHDNALVGYGLVTGLAGTGDSSRSAGTVQSISNVLRRFGINVSPEALRSRNAAGVMVTTTLPPFARMGDKLDINVTSLGDARSLLGGTLVLTHLNGSDGELYALAQGPLSIGGFKFDLNGNVVQRNHPTAGTVPNGATVERNVLTRLRSPDGTFDFVLYDPDFTTASRIAAVLNSNLGANAASAVDAGRVRVSAPHFSEPELIEFLTVAEGLTVEPDQRAIIVVNERTGTVVSGGDVRVSAVTISHGNLRVSISTEYTVSQPYLVRDTGPGVRTVVVPNTDIEVEEEVPASLSLPDGSTVADLVEGLNRVGASSRDIIVILQGAKRAGALRADLVIQ